LHGEYAALSSNGKRALLEFLVQENPKWLEAIGADFDALAHDYQRPPRLANGGKPWTTWLILGGRGSGKTRAGAQWVRGLALNDPAARIALIGETKHDAREVMVEGVSGLLAVHRHDERPQWLPTRQRLEWSNGAVAQVFSAEEPEGLRGPQFSAAWLDELAKWRQAEATFDMLQFGLRLGERPRQVITTTPRPIALIKKLADDARTALTHGGTASNAYNLAADAVWRR
jgi:phage terminase large subunit-like protein